MTDPNIIDLTGKVGEVSGRMGAVESELSDLKRVQGEVFSAINETNLSVQKMTLVIEAHTKAEDERLKALERKTRTSRSHKTDKTAAPTQQAESSPMDKKVGTVLGEWLLAAGKALFIGVFVALVVLGVMSWKGG